MQLSSGLLPKQYPRDSLQKDIQDRILYKIYITRKKERKMFGCNRKGESMEEKNQVICKYV